MLNHHESQLAIEEESDVSKKYGAVIFMTLVAIVFLVLHFITGRQAFVDEAASQGQDAAWSEYWIVWARDTVENLQSEFWQLAVQFALLAGLLRFIGVQAYEEDEEDVKHRLVRVEQKLDELREQSH